MRNRELLFKLMIWSLGIAAASGVLAALTASYDTVGRVAATAFLTCGIAGSLWFVYRQFENQDAAAHIAEGSFGAAFLFALLGIWSVGNFESTWGTAMSLFFCGALAAGGCGLRSRSGWELSGTVIVAASTMSLVLFLAAFWIASGQFEGKLVATGLSLLGWTLPGAFCLAGEPSALIRPSRWIGVGAAGFGLLLTILITTETIPSADWIGKLLLVSGSVTVIVVHANLCAMASLTERQNWLRQGTIGATVLTAVFTDLCLLFEVSDGILPRLAFASAIPASFGTMAVLFTSQYNKWSQRSPRAVAPAELSPAGAASSWHQALTLECPACETRQRIAVGSSQCTQCGLGFEVRLLEPKQTSDAA